jgi:hypothetical protein
MAKIHKHTSIFFVIVIITMEDVILSKEGQRSIPTWLQKYRNTEEFKEWYREIEKHFPSETEFRKCLYNSKATFLKILLIEISADKPYSLKKTELIETIDAIFKEYRKPINTIIETPECAVCLNELSLENECILNCDHKYCVFCISYMMITTEMVKCPLCRKHISTLFVMTKDAENVCKVQNSHHYHSIIVINCKYINWLKINKYIRVNHISLAIEWIWVLIYTISIYSFLYFMLVLITSAWDEIFKII